MRKHGSKTKIGSLSRVLLVAALVALPFSACDIDRTDEGELPEVEIEGGELPEYDVDTADVDVHTDEKTVTVPDVDVEMEEKTVEVPDVDVDMPDDDDETPLPERREPTPGAR